MLISISIIIIILIAFLVIRYVPFGERAKFVGTWYQQENSCGYAMTFYSDGTCSDKGWPGTWELKDGKLIIKAQDGHSTYGWYYSFSDNGRTLNLSGRGTWIKWGD